MKILINTPDLSLAGGVANHYKGLLGHWSTKVKYNYVGGRKIIPGLFILPFDYIKFVVLCLSRKYDIIILNPSLNKNAIARDAVFLKIAVFFKKKCFVFWHGWDKQQEIKISSNPKKFLDKYKYADGFLVLASEFKMKLKQWGLNAPIHLTSTKVDDNLLVNFEISKKQYQEFNILFLARLEKEKGIYTTIEVFEILQEKYPNVNLYIAGSGSESRRVREFVDKRNLNNVHFLGNISGNELIQVFEKNTVYVLPTTHGEGMPTSVLEAMAFGLPVITRPVGGINDFFENGKMGYLINSVKPEDYIEKTTHLIENTEIIIQMGQYNYDYAKKHFMASKVAKQIEKIVQSV